MSQYKIEKAIDKSDCKLTQLPRLIKYEISSYLDKTSQKRIASFYCHMFGSKGNFFQEYKLLSKLSEFIASGKIEKIEELRELRPDLSSQIDKIVQIELFKLAGAGEQDKIEQLLKRYPELLLSSAPLKDISGIELVIDGKKGITLFQHAIWAKDVRYMCNMMLDCLPKTHKGEEIRQKLVEQCKELMEKDVVYELKGQTHREKQFSLKPLIDALQTYVNQFDNWTWDERESHWCTVVGLAQTLLPAIVRQHYCDPEESFKNPNFRKPKFKRCLEFYNYLNSKMESWGSSLAGLGSDFGIIRSDGAGGRAVHVGVATSSLDLAALTAFDEVRTEDLNLLIQRLQNPIQILEENQERIFGNY